MCGFGRGGSGRGVFLDGVEVLWVGQCFPRLRIGKHPPTHKTSEGKGTRAIPERSVRSGKHPRAISSPSRDVPPVRPQILYTMEYTHEIILLNTSTCKHPHAHPHVGTYPRCVLKKTGSNGVCCTNLNSYIYVMFTIV
jgi:hypothetical protein